MRKSEKKKATLFPTEEGPLQNPTAPRKFIVPACVAGAECHKIFVDDESAAAVCRAYLDPKAVQCQQGIFNACAIKQKIGNEEEVKTFINPIKASKRGL
jgi:hypothetical protein